MWTGASWYIQKGFRRQTGPVSGQNWRRSHRSTG